MARFLIHDNDRKFIRTFDAVLESEAFHVIRPVLATWLIRPKNWGVKRIS